MVQSRRNLSISRPSKIRLIPCDLNRWEMGKHDGMFSRSKSRPCHGALFGWIKATHSSALLVFLPRACHQNRLSSFTTGNCVERVNSASSFLSAVTFSHSQGVSLPIFTRFLCHEWTAHCQTLVKGERMRLINCLQFNCHSRSETQGEELHCILWCLSLFYMLRLFELWWWIGTVSFSSHKREADRGKKKKKKKDPPTWLCPGWQWFMNPISVGSVAWTS